LNLKDSNETVDDIMQNIAHQWRQPLSQINSIVLAIDAILEKNGTHSDALETRLLEIEALTKYMSNTIDDFNKNDEKVCGKSFYILDAIDEAISFTIGSLNDNGINLTTDIDGTVECFGNKGELLQVIVVIINNAKDAILERNKFNAIIDITAKIQNDISIIQISDNGGGMTKKMMDKIFNPDFTTKHKSEGTGIGLSMSKKIIEENLNGELNVKNYNEGTCFEIRLK